VKLLPFSDYFWRCLRRINPTNVILPGKDAYVENNTNHMLRTKSALIFAATGLIQWAIWLCYTDSTGYREIIAGAIAAVISTVAVAVFARQAKLRFRFGARHVLQGIYLPWNVLTDTRQLLRALGKQLFSRKGAGSLTAAIAFDAGGNDAASAGRRALAVTYTTITPNCVVLGIVRDKRLMIYHQLLPANVSTMTCNLGARP
jgi:multisubunit Na+/H+ antiporter MnhE subunit